MGFFGRFKREQKPEKLDEREILANKLNRELLKAAKDSADNTKKLNALLEEDNDSVTLKIFIATGGVRRMK